MAQRENVQADARAQSPLPPLQYPLFRAVWIATLTANIGVWMQNVAAAWLMTSISDSPLMVALIQTAITLPAFLFGLPAGVIADLVEKRKLLLITHAWMLLIPGLVLVWVGAFSPLHTHSITHAVVMTAGGLLLAAAHMINLRLTHAAIAIGSH